MREKFYSLTEKLKNILKSLYGGHLAAPVHDKSIGNDQLLHPRCIPYVKRRYLSLTKLVLKGQGSILQASL